MKKLMFCGHRIEGEMKDIVSQQEGWNNYLLNDGTVVRAKIVCTKIIHSEIPELKMNEGYGLEGRIVVDVSTPDKGFE